MSHIFYKGMTTVIQGFCFVNLDTSCFMLKCNVAISLKWALKVFFFLYFFQKSVFFLEYAVRCC